LSGWRWPARVSTHDRWAGSNETLPGGWVSSARAAPVCRRFRYGAVAQPTPERHLLRSTPSRCCAHGQAPASGDAVSVAQVVGRGWCRLNGGLGRAGVKAGGGRNAGGRTIHGWGRAMARSVADTRGGATGSPAAIVRGFPAIDPVSTIGIASNGTIGIASNGTIGIASNGTIVPAAGPVLRSDATPRLTPQPPARDGAGRCQTTDAQDRPRPRPQQATHPLPKSAVCAPAPPSGPGRQRETMRRPAQAPSRGASARTSAGPCATPWACR
jgi:hypothetical protein